MSVKRTHQHVSPTRAVDAYAPGLGMLDVVRTLTRGDMVAAKTNRPLRSRTILLLAISMGVILVFAIGMHPTPGNRHSADRLSRVSRRQVLNRAFSLRWLAYGPSSVAPSCAGCASSGRSGQLVRCKPPEGATLDPIYVGSAGS